MWWDSEEDVCLCLCLWEMSKGFGNRRMPKHFFLMCFCHTAHMYLWVYMWMWVSTGLLIIWTFMHLSGVCAYLSVFIWMNYRGYDCLLRGIIIEMDVNKASTLSQQIFPQRFAMWSFCLNKGHHLVQFELCDVSIFGVKRENKMSQYSFTHNLM